MEQRVLNRILSENPDKLDEYKALDHEDMVSSPPSAHERY